MVENELKEFLQWIGRHTKSLEDVTKLWSASQMSIGVVEHADRSGYLYCTYANHSGRISMKIGLTPKGTQYITP